MGKEFQANSKLADITIVCDRHNFSCHSALLASISPVFEAMFSHCDLLETRSKTIKIEDAKPPAVKAMIDFAYSNEVPDIDNIALDLLKLADKYNMADLLAYCSIALEKTISVGTCVALWSSAST